MRKVLLTVFVLFNLFLARCSCGKEDAIIILPPSNPPIPCKIDKECLKDSFGSCFAGICISKECHFGYYIDGTPCDDKNPCTDFGECFKGNCIQGEFIKCPTPNQCQEEGKCNIFTGQCEYANKLNGLPCNDNNSCTLMDQCKDGECIHLDKKDCPPLNPCLFNGTCNTETGECEYTYKLDGTPCDDGVWCNGIESCQEGTCIPGNPPCGDQPCDEINQICAPECVEDSDCDNGINCDGQEWCCTWEKSNWGCEKYHCYDGFSPCGSPVWSVMTVCDCDWDDPCNDACRPCRQDCECDDGCWCNGLERCGTEAEGHHWGLCLHVPNSNPCPNQYCNEKKKMCAPECIDDNQCPPEQYCDSGGKCHDL